MARVSKTSAPSGKSLYATNHYDPTPPKKPNRKFQLALQGLNKQIDRQKPKQELRSEPQPLKATDARIEPKISFTQAARSAPPSEPSKISFVRSSPKLSPPPTPEFEPTRLAPRPSAGYRTSPHHQPNPPKTSLSFVRPNKAESEKSRPPVDAKDRPAIATSGHFKRSIFGLTNQPSRPSRPSTPYSRPVAETVKPKPAAIQKLSSPPTTSPSSEATPPQPSPPAAKATLTVPKAEGSAPARSILDRLGTTKQKRKLSRSPSPEKAQKREKKAMPVPQSKPAPQISSRLGPAARQPVQDHAVPQAARAHQNNQHVAPPARTVHQGHQGPSHGYNQQPQASPNHVPPFRKGTGSAGQQFHGRANFNSHSGPRPGMGYGQSYKHYPPVPPRCSYFPLCNREGCFFFHPTEDCPNGSHCQEGVYCRFAHPAEREKAKCKFDEKCTRVECPFIHESRRFTIGDPDAYLAVPCTGECPGQTCAKLHPTDVLPHQSTDCLYYHRCNRPPCNYYHFSTFRKNKARKEVSVPKLTSLFKEFWLVEDQEDMED